MSKSLGNLVKVNQALQRAPAAAVRLYLVSHRYGRDWDFSWTGLARMARLVERIRDVLADDARRGRRAGAPSAALVRQFDAAIADDLDTPDAIRVLRRAVREKDAAAVRGMLDVLAGTASLS